MLSNVQATTVIKSIIDRQRTIMGPLADEQAKKVMGLSVTDTGAITIKSKDHTGVLSDLVKTYEHLFGRASVEVCKDAIRETQLSLADDDLPDILR
jgi:hypothetical protein